MQNVTSYLAGIGVFLSLFLSSLIAVRRESGGTRLYLSAFILASGLSTTYQVLFPTGLFRVLPHLVKTYIPPQFLLGPLLYFYVSSVLEENYRPSRRALLHLVPFALSIVYLAPFFLSSGEEKIAFVEATILSRAPSNGEEWVVWLYLQGSLWAYALAALARLRDAKKKTAGKASVQVRHIRAWLRLFLSGVLGALALFLVVDGFMLAGAPLVRFNSLISMIVASNIVVLGWRGVANPDHVAPPEPAPAAAVPEAEAELLNRRFRELRLSVAAQGFFRDPDLALPGLALKLGHTRNELSRIINAGGNVSFLAFIYGLRVEEAKRVLDEGGSASRNLLSLSWDVGFRNKSTFNSAFKRFTGFTPSEYRELAKAGRKTGAEGLED